MFLDLCASQISLQGLKSLCDSFRSNISLLGLDISNNYLGPNMVKPLSASIPASNLEELSLANNRLTDVGVTALAPLFGKMNTNSIKVLQV